MDLLQFSSLAMTDQVGGPSGAPPHQAQQPGQQTQQPGQQAAQPGQQAGQPGQQPPQQGQPNASVAQPSGKKKSGGCFKWVLGCGCLSVILFMLVGVAGAGYVFWQVPKTVGADSWGETVEFVDGAQRLAGGAASGVGEEPADLEQLARSDNPEEREQFNQAVSGLDQFFDDLDETSVSGRDVSKVQDQMEDWNESKPARDFTAVLENLEKLDKEPDSAINGFKKLRGVVQLAFRANDLGLAYRDFLEDMSASERNNYNQIIAIARLSQFSASGGHEPWEQAVADAILEDHDENREAYEKARSLYRAAAEDPDFDPEELSEEEQRMLSEAFTNQFVMITSAINRDSLQTWSRLSDEERKEIMESIDNPQNFIARIMAGTVHAREDEQGLLYVRLLGF